MRHRPRIDANHVEIVKALRQAGASVQSLAGVGKGCPDLLVARAGQMWLIEVKDGAAISSKRRLTDDERRWHQRWPATVYVAQSAAEALAIIGIKPVVLNNCIAYKNPDPVAQLGKVLGESLAKCPK